MTRPFPCVQCGADLKFEPGTRTLRCPYCGSDNEIPASGTALEEVDFRAFLAQAGARQETVEVMTVRCPACAAQTTFGSNVTAGLCAFCGTSLVETASSRRCIKPHALLPFQVTDRAAAEAFRAWLKKRWFAPNALKQYARQESGLQGVYLPYWTYDAATTTRYTGRRGEHYYVTETYTAQENGKSVQRTRQVQKTRWYPASGVVHNRFDDVLVVATEVLPRPFTTRLEPWDLAALVPYDDAFLSGFRAESYAVGLDQGFTLAQEVMEGPITASIHHDIGGDEQQILVHETRYDDVTFKHVLLPVWVSAYRYRDRAYRFLVNARTGEVQGERPWSGVKITLAVLLALLVIAAIILVAATRP
jgi:ribosomal protein S27E